jgi:glycerophosphoryl diester phosphodiesterase
VSGDEPGNTLEAFAASVARGVEGIELDVRRTADGVLVIAHDPMLGGCAVAQSPYEELVAVTPSLCTLGEALEVVPRVCHLDIELKVPGLEADVLEALEPKREKGDFVVTSFLDETIARVKALDPDVQAGLILGEGRPREGMRARLSEYFPARRLRRSVSDLVAPNLRVLRCGFLLRMRRLGYPVYVWTVNQPDLLERMLRHPGVTAVITDRPLEAMAVRAELD